MVQSLKDVCLNYVVKNFYTIKNFKPELLSAEQKQSIIERLSNHNLLFITSSCHNCESKFVCLDVAQYNFQYQVKLIKYFFNGHLNQLHFDDCNQLNHTFLNLISKLVSPNDLSIKCLKINRCKSLSDESISSFVSNYAKNLSEITLNYMNYPLESTLAHSIRSLNLYKADLSYCNSINDDDIWHLCKNNPYIRILKLTNCSQLTNKGIRAALHMLIKLEHLDIEGIKEEGTGFYIDAKSVTLNTAINFKAIKKLTFCGSNELNGSAMMKKLFENCTNLRELNIMYSSNSSNDINSYQNFEAMSMSIENTPLDGMAGALSKSLTTLSLYKPNIHNSNHLIEFLLKLDNLQRLSMYGVGCLDDKSLKEILKEIGPSLTLLNLGGFMIFERKLTEESIRNICKYCKNLKSLSFNLFSTSICFESLRELFENEESAHKLEDLCFSACKSLSYNILTQVGKNCINLIKLDLSGLSQQVNDDLLILISNTARKLKSIDIKGCFNVTDEAVISLAVNCPLEVMVLAGLNSLTDKCVIIIANHLQSSLSEIYLSGCSKISSASLNYLIDCCVNRLNCHHKVPNKDQNFLMAKNLDTGFFERVDLLNYRNHSYNF